jgi:hypothetical protein
MGVELPPPPLYNVFPLPAIGSSSVLQELGEAVAVSRPLGPRHRNPQEQKSNSCETLSLPDKYNISCNLLSVPPKLLLFPSTLKNFYSIWVPPMLLFPMSLNQDVCIYLRSKPYCFCK